MSINDSVNRSITIAHLSNSFLVAATRYNAQAQFKEFDTQVKRAEGRLNAIVEGVLPMLDLIDLDGPLELLPRTGVRPPRPDAIIDRCKASWENFKQFSHDAAESIGAHVLAVVLSHYPGVRPKKVATGWASGTSERRAEELRETSEAAAKSLAADVDLFNETGQTSQ